MAKQASKLNDSNDSFLLLKKVYIDFCYHKVTKTCIFLLVISQTTFYFLQIHFLLSHLSLELLARYSTIMMITTVALFGLILSFCIEKNIHELYEIMGEIAWSLDEASKKDQNELSQTSRKINNLNLYFLEFLAFLIIILLPVFGDEKNLFLCILVFDEYFGEWAFIPYHLYFIGFPFLCYFSVQLCFMFLYATLHLHVQIYLFNNFIVKMATSFDFFSDWKKIHSGEYQEEISRQLCQCIQQDVALKKFLPVSVP
ncbi:uncharacterized protein LOC123009157 [Tribolium madens]|uniref:uncharacterized protein LOC123009157 n=1 Tax=Tribolium madens TaxID=41895 RepID=UPI001CF71F50|nr:uncharacterized protein LOC123009157 [Tribolium madens]